MLELIQRREKPAASWELFLCLVCPSGLSGLVPASSGTLLSATDPDSNCTCRAPTGPGRVPATFPGPCRVEAGNEWRLERRSTASNSVADVALGNSGLRPFGYTAVALRGWVTWCVQRKPRSAIASGVLTELLLQPWGWALTLWRNPGHQSLPLSVYCIT